MTRLREIGRTANFWPKWAKNKWDCWTKSENVASVALGSPNFEPKIRKFL